MQNQRQKEDSKWAPFWNVRRRAVPDFDALFWSLVFFLFLERACVQGATFFQTDDGSHYVTSGSVNPELLATGCGRMVFTNETEVGPLIATRCLDMFSLFAGPDTNTTRTPAVECILNNAGQRCLSQWMIALGILAGALMCAGCAHFACKRRLPTRRILNSECETSEAVAKEMVEFLEEQNLLPRDIIKIIREYYRPTRLFLQLMVAVDEAPAIQEADEYYRLDG